MEVTAEVLNAYFQATESERCRREILRICELMKLRIFDTETNRIQ